MHPRTQELLDGLDAGRAELRRAVDAVPPALRERRPAPERWSVAEVIDHLRIVQGRVTQVLADTLAARRGTLAPERDTTPVTPRLDPARVASRERRIVAGAASQPRADVRADAAWAELEQGGAALREVVRSADGLALGDVQVPHPAFGPLDLYQWILFVAGHDARHAAQIRDDAAALAAER